MTDSRGGERFACFLLGTLAGASAAMLMAPDSGARTRRKIRRKAEDAADYMLDAGRDLVDNCEDLYRSSSELIDDGARELSHRYRDLLERSKQLVDETAEALRR